GGAGSRRRARRGDAVRGRRTTARGVAPERLMALQRTYFMIKPEVVRRNQFAAVLDLVLANRFAAERLELRSLTADVARRFYAEHEARSFFGDLVAYMTSGPVVCVQLAGDDAQARLRRLVGATDPAKAEVGTVRYRFGTSLQENAVHASDS